MNSQSPAVRRVEDKIMKDSGRESIWEPQCVYFYYLRPVDVDHADVSAYFADMRFALSDEVMVTLIEKFVDEAQSENYQHLVPIGKFFGHVAWTRQSYLVIVVDTGYTIHHVEIKHSGHTIQEGTPFKTGRGLFGIIYKNWVAKSNNHEWNKKKEDEETFQIDFHFQSTRIAGRAGRRSHEDTGTNLGPPVPPP